MKTRLGGLLRNLVVTPPLIAAGLAYGVAVGFLMGLGMASLLGDEWLGVRVPSRPLRGLLRLGLGSLIVAVWVAVGLAVGGLLPLVDRGTFVGILRYGLPLRRQGLHTTAPQPASE